MSKATGLGSAFYIDGFDLSGDVGSLQKISTPMSPLIVTGISKFAFERLSGKRDGGLDWTCFWNSAANQEHPVLSTMPSTDRVASFVQSPTLFGDVFSINAKQVNYAPDRATDGALTIAVSVQANQFGAEWGNLLTPGVRTDTTPTTPGTGVDFTTVSTAFGWQAYLQVLAVTGTSVTLTIQDSADNATFLPLASGAFTAATPGASTQRLQGGPTDTVRRYLRVVSTGTFSNAQFLVHFTRNAAAVNF